jgi:hypothetical protein
MCCSKLFLGNNFSKKVLTHQELLMLLSIEGIDKESPDSVFDMVKFEADCEKLAEGLKGLTIEVYCRWKNPKNPQIEYMRLLDCLSSFQDGLYRGFRYITEINGIEGISCAEYSYLDILDEVKFEISCGADYCYIIPVEACE